MTLIRFCAFRQNIEYPPEKVEPFPQYRRHFHNPQNSWRSPEPSQNLQPLLRILDICSEYRTLSVVSKTFFRKFEGFLKRVPPAYQSFCRKLEHFVRNLKNVSRFYQSFLGFYEILCLPSKYWILPKKVEAFPTISMEFSHSPRFRQNLQAPLRIFDPSSEYWKFLRNMERFLRMSKTFIGGSMDFSKSEMFSRFCRRILTILNMVWQNFGHSGNFVTDFGSLFSFSAGCSQILVPLRSFAAERLDSLMIRHWSWPRAVDHHTVLPLLLLCRTK
jgi:hypothetical protein